MRHLLLLLTILFLAQPVSAQRQSWFIAPKTTDNQINSALESHYVAINRSVKARNQLFLFFPGTDGTPFFYQQISNTAADMGYHVINLRYVNFDAVNTLCGRGRDLDCYEKVRLEIIDGTDRTSLVSVDRTNSVENRLIKLLQFLQVQYPNDGWQQYLKGSSEIDWSKIVTSGHSQGGGHAGILGKVHRVARVVMFAAQDYNGLTQKPANWITAEKLTPESDFYGFSHQRDDKINFNILSNVIWPAYGMDKFGTPVNVDNTTTPYNNSHSLFTNVDLVSSNDFHGSVVVDVRVPKLSDGTPIFKDVWVYLLSTTDSSDKESPKVSDLLLSKTKVVRKKDASLEISWKSTDNSEVVTQTILLAEDGINFTKTIVTGLAGSVQNFVWIVPSAQMKTKNAAIKIVAKDQAGNIGEAVSKKFTIK